MASSPSAAAAPLSPSPATPPAAATTGDHSPSATPLALPAQNCSVTTSRRLPPPCWTQEETLALIESYREKWHGLRRGNLRAADWQDVADTVAVRCPEVTPAKTPIQCRHKIEKLRKRFRSERQRAFANNRPSNWPYYPLLDAMEISGPNPIPPPAKAVRTPPSSTSSDEEDELDRRNTRSIHGLMSNGGPAGLKFSIPKASRSKAPNPSLHPQFNPNPDANKFVKGYDHMMAAAAAARSPLEEMMQMKTEKKRRLEREIEEEEEEEGGGEEEAFGDVAMAIRAFGEGFLRVEKMKMEMAREIEKNRMEMELKRTEMMLDMQRRLVDAVVKGFVGKKRTRLED